MPVLWDYILFLCTVVYLFTAMQQSVSARNRYISVFMEHWSLIAGDRNIRCWKVLDFFYWAGNKSSELQVVFSVKSGCFPTHTVNVKTLLTFNHDPNRDLELLLIWGLIKAAFCQCHGLQWFLDLAFRHKSVPPFLLI